MAFAQAFIIGEEFIGCDDCALVLGDNIFYGHDLPKLMDAAVNKESGATVFAYHVNDPERYGVVEFDKTERQLAGRKTITTKKQLCCNRTLFL